MQTEAPVTVHLQTRVRRKLADMLTPVSAYMKLRDHYRNPLLLESNDFRSAENCFSFIALEPIAGFEVAQGTIRRTYPNGQKLETSVDVNSDVTRHWWEFLQQFEVEPLPNPQLINGFFGYTAFDAVRYFDSHSLDNTPKEIDIPEINYHLYRFLIAFDHFREVMYLIENLPEGAESQLDRLEALLEAQNSATYPFRLDGDESSNMTDERFKELVRLGRQHCQLGDVFQLVFSRQFRQSFQGDEFNIYRVLRSINPSPYLFYFDFGNYRIFGSSPEAQLVIRDGLAQVNPIAGTYPRTGDDEVDARRAQELANDPKENAEHIMLVDLARNDLGRFADSVRVKELKEIQYFSHVIHLVSTVEGTLQPGANPLDVFASTFPAGTLSGAPKHRAIELIHQNEPHRRSFYGGAIGYIGFEGQMNQAIVIRSMLSRHNTLYYQAGAGIVIDSQEEKELQEVNNKLGALTNALREAQNL
jgi:anthranilate synthase component 1